METDPSVLSIHPNPVNDQLTIIHSDLTKEAVITVYDINGRKLLSKTTVGKAQTTLDVSPLVNGIYFIECLSGEKRTVLKFVKQ